MARQTLAPLDEDLLRRCSFPTPQAKVDCAVSGGADSLALLLLASLGGFEVTAIHVDHGIRPGGQSEAANVESVASRLGANFKALRLGVAPGPNLEARAREARYSVLPEGVLTGHTADDRAETMLINLMRGAGLDGLAAMRPERKPLLGLRRCETRDLCDRHGLPVFEDPSNTDPAHLRNRVRHELLPAMDQLANRDVARVLARQADVLADDSDFLEALAGEIDVTDARELSAAPLPLARRAVRQWIRLECGIQGNESHPPSRAEVDRVLAVARGEFVACELAGGRRVARSLQRLRIE